MNRFFGMMPRDEVAISKRFKDASGLSITIEAGIHGWTIMYADHSADYKDTDTTSEENFNTAYKTAVENLGELTLIEHTSDSCCGEM